MTRINFIKKRFSGRTAALLDKVTQVIAEYQDKGYSLTLRQLYYQLVSKNIVENLPREYKKLSRLLTDARMAGMVDWDAIEDRGRVSRIPAHFENLQEFAMAAANSYRLDRWKNQNYYIEVWVEKDALSGVIEPITRKYHVNLLVNRGYSSASAIFESAQRMTRQAYGIHKNCVILYLGDHDPSVTGKTPILTKIGETISLMPIKQIVELLKNKTDLQVLAMDKNTLQVEFKEAVGYFEHMSSDIYKIRYSSGEVECTGNHSVYVFDSKGMIVSKPSSELKVGEFLVTFCGNIIKNTKSHVFEIPKMPSNKILPDKITLDRNFARILGFYTAEGFVKTQKDIPVGIQFCFNKPTEHELIGETTLLMTKIFNISPTNKEPQTYMSKPVSKLFRTIYPAKTAKEKSIPNELWTSDRDTVIEFLEGYMEGDGHITPKTRRTWKERNMTTASKNLACQLNWLLRCNGIPTRFESGMNKSHYKKDGSFIKGGPTYHVIIPAFWFRDVKKTVMCTRIPNVFKNVKLIKPRNSWLRGMRVDTWKVINHENARKLSQIVKLDDYKKRLVESDLGIARINEIIKTGKHEMVYDITVKDASNFFGGTTPVLLHNSGEDMVRDIQERLYRFHVNVKVEKIALTRNQVKKYKLPPNPTKRSDTRSPRYRAEHGDKSWELDALGPEVLREILECSIKQYLDLKKYDKIVRKEEDEKQRLVQLCKSLT